MELIIESSMYISLGPVSLISKRMRQAQCSWAKWISSFSIPILLATQSSCWKKCVKPQPF